MTQKQYLDKLRNNLRFRLSDMEIDDILSDMRECFEAGISEGKTEEEICLSLGTPKDAAVSLLNEQEKGTSGFIANLMEYWLPVIISIAVIGVFLYMAMDMEIRISRDSNIVFYIVPLILWFLLERTSSFRSIIKYKADFFTFAGSVLTFSAGIICCDFIKKVLIAYDTCRSPAHAIAMTALIFLSLTMLVLSVRKCAPKPFLIVTIILAVPVMCRAIQSCLFFSSVLKASISVVGSYTCYCLEAILGSAVLILIWSLICRNSLTLPALYLSVMMIGYMVYIWQLLSVFDPAYNYSAEEARCLMDGQNYFIGGAVSACIMLTVIIFVKILSRRKAEK